MGVAVGIDLGTTNTVVSAVKDGWPVTLVDEANRRLLPSVVSFHPSGKVLVGHSARDRRIVDATNTIGSVKRLIGRTWNSLEVQRVRKTMAFELVEGDSHEVQVLARGERYTLPEISAFILRRAKAIAEAALGEPVQQAVITVPANFNDPQREATKLAGKLAGLDVLRILSEPTAAALAYGESVGKKERVAVYDLGGGTFDVTVLDVSGAVFQVLATGGDTALGGDDIDELVAGLMVDALLRQFRYDARTDPTARATLKARAEDLKITLSSNPTGSLTLDRVVRGEGGAFLPASFSLDRKVLETLATPLIERTLETARKTLEKIGMTVADVDRVLLVGGSTRMPLVGRRVEECFHRKVSARVNPDEVVAHGAAVQAAALARGMDVAKPSLRPRPSFSFAPDMALPPADGGAGAPRPTPRVGDVTVPLPPRVPGGIAQGARPSSLPPAPPGSRTPLSTPAASAPIPPAPMRPSKPAPPASSRPSTPPLSQDQEALLRAFLGGAGRPDAPAPPAPPPRPGSLRPPSEVESELLAFLSDAPPPLEGARRSAPPTALPREDASSPESLKPPMSIKAVESELLAFLSGAPPPPDEPITAVLEAPDLDLKPLPSVKPAALATASTPPKEAGIESELRAFLGTEAIVAVVDQPQLPPGQAPQPPPLPPRASARPDRGSAIPTLGSHPAPVISEQTPRITTAGPPSTAPRPASTAPLLIDVTPLSLGVETVGGFCDVIIRANSPVPCERSRSFRTASDGQTAVVLKVCQGESERFLENTTLGDVRLSGFRAAPRGEIEISVTFEIDADGILRVRASEVASGRTAIARIELLGAQMDPKKMQEMIDRQARREVA